MLSFKILNFLTYLKPNHMLQDFDKMNIKKRAGSKSDTKQNLKSKSVYTLYFFLIC